MSDPGVIDPHEGVADIDVPAEDGRVPLNLGTEPVSRRVYALIFNGLTLALTAEQWMPLDERERVTAAIYDALSAGGIEVRLADGLERLRRVADEIASLGRRVDCDQVHPQCGVYHPDGHDPSEVEGVRSTFG